MSFSFGAETRDSLSNLAASLGAGKDKAAGDAFFVYDLSRSQVEAMYRGDWLARKVVDIVPYDMVREWRAWSGPADAVARAEAAERRLGLRKAVQRALVLGRLYGGGAIIIGTGERDPAALAYPLEEDWLRPGGLKFLHVVSRWQLGAAALNSDPLSPWCGEPALYELAAAGRAPLMLHPSRVVRFLGNPLPDPWATASPWSDSVLQALYDAVHAAALTVAGATSLMHEAKVDVVTVPNLSEHLSSAETTEQLSARFAYAAAMKSINNLLLLGDGETWSRQSVDLGGLPEMVRTFLQVAAGAADIPVTRLLGQSPSGLSATGESDTRNYYDMIAARQELDLRPQLERLDRLMLRSAGLDPAALTFAFRPLWQLDAASAAAIALQKAQATQIYAGLKLWPAAVTARLVEAQLVQDGTYPNAAAVFAEGEAAEDLSTRTRDGFSAGAGALHYLTEPRKQDGTWTAEGASTAKSAIVSVAQHINEDPDPTPEEEQEELEEHLKEREDPLKRFRFGLDPSGIVRIPMMPGSGKPTTRPPINGGTEAPVDPETPKTGAGPDRTSSGKILGPTGLPVAPTIVSPAGSTEPAQPTAVRPRPSTPQSSAPPSFTGRFDEPPNPGTYGASKALASIKIPSDLSLDARGKTASEQGKCYQDEVRKALNFNAVPRPPGEKFEKGDSDPDGLQTDPENDLQIALEVKYFNKKVRGINDPDNMLMFINSDAVAQARKYLDKFKGGLLWIVNDRELVYKYDYLFRKNGLSGFRIEYIGSK